MSAVPVSAVRSLTDQNFSHSARENKMLLSIELSRERIRDMERRYTGRHTVVPSDGGRRAGKSIMTRVSRLGQFLTNRP